MPRYTIRERHVAIDLHDIAAIALIRKLQLPVPALQLLLRDFMEQRVYLVIVAVRPVFNGERDFSSYQNLKRLCNAD